MTVMTELEVEEADGWAERVMVVLEITITLKLVVEALDCEAGLVVLSADRVEDCPNRVEDNDDDPLSEPEYDKPELVELEELEELRIPGETVPDDEPDLLDPEDEDKLDREERVKELEGGAVYVETVELLVYVVLETKTPLVKLYEGVVELVLLAKQDSGVVTQHGSE